MKLLIALLLISTAALGQGPNTQIISVPYDGAGHTRLALLTLPDDYGTTTTVYPLIGFGHGVGELGDGSVGGLSKIYTNSNAGGPAYYIAQGKWPSSFTNPADGKQYKFLVLTPQYKNGSTFGNLANGSTTAQEWDFILTYMYKTYRVDTNRVYLTGLSAGGAGVCNFMTRYQYTPIHHIAAAAPMSAEIGTPSQAMENNIISDSIHVWGFGAEADGLGIATHELVIGAYNGNGGSLKGLGYLGKWTSYTCPSANGHGCWGPFYSPTYGLYSWFLQFTRAKPGPPVVVVPPVPACPVCPTCPAPIVCPTCPPVVVCPPPVICPVCPPIPAKVYATGISITLINGVLTTIINYSDGTQGPVGSPGQ